jgi:hypothetical protein
MSSAVREDAVIGAALCRRLGPSLQQHDVTCMSFIPLVAAVMLLSRRSVDRSQASAPPDSRGSDGRGMRNRHAQRRSPAGARSPPVEASVVSFVSATIGRADGRGNQEEYPVSGGAVPISHMGTGLYVSATVSLPDIEDYANRFSISVVLNAPSATF